MEMFVVGPKGSQNNPTGYPAEVDESELYDPSCYDIHFLMTGKSVPASADIT